MLEPDVLRSVESDARAIYREAGEDHREPVSIGALCQRLTGHPPRVVEQPQEARLIGGRVFLRPGLLTTRARWLVGHEIGEWFYGRRSYETHDVEARCDALGAALVAPREAFLGAARAIGENTHALALAFGITQSCALLRIGEATGRPVLLLREGGAIGRGEARLGLAVGLPGLLHVPITDEPEKAGVMAIRTRRAPRQ